VLPGYSQEEKDIDLRHLTRRRDVRLSRFIHDSDLHTLLAGQQWNFDVVPQDKMKRALNLTPLFWKERV